MSFAHARLVVGSLIGAAAIHLAFVACSSMPTIADAGRDAGPLQDAVSEAARDVLAMETGDALADDGGLDGGMCACPTLPTAPTYSFSALINGVAPFNPASTTSMEVRQVPPAVLPPGRPTPAFFVIAHLSLWVPVGTGSTSAATYVDMTCGSFEVDASGVDYPTITCRMVNDGDPTAFATGNGTVTILAFTPTSVQFRIDSLVLNGGGSGGLQPPTITSLVFRASDPAGHLLDPRGAYVP